jgi:biopolymer transport protein ExbB
VKRATRRIACIAGLLVVVLCVWARATQAAEGAAAAAGGAAAATVEPAAGGGEKTTTEAAPGASMSLVNVIFRAGWFGVIIWALLFACSISFVALVIDSFITVNKQRIAPDALADHVRSAIAQGDLTQALEACEASATPLGRILMAGFANVQDGYEVVQDAVGVAADLETEILLGRISYLSVISNTTPMLGLIGTVQGMIYAFHTLGTQQAGAAQQAMLAVNISHGLWATAIGLGVAVPAALFFYFFKNRTMRMILGMEALTLDVIKALRHAEVVEE